ncbi:MAG: hypothetical protein ACKOAF_04995 [Actinomycetes bacterium]
MTALTDADVCRCHDCAGWKVRARLCAVCTILIQQQCVESIAERAEADRIAREAHEFVTRLRAQEAQREREEAELHRRELLAAVS